MISGGITVTVNCTTRLLKKRQKTIKQPYVNLGLNLSTLVAALCGKPMSFFCVYTVCKLTALELYCGSIIVLALINTQ